MVLSSRTDAARGEEASEALRVDLVRRVARGEEGALEALHRDLERPVLALVARLVGERRPAEEVTVEVFVRLWRRAATFENARGTVLAWVLSMARSLAVDELRARQREPHGTLEERALEGRAVDPTHGIESRETATRIADALRALPRDQERLLRAAYFGGRSYREVAEAFGQPLGTVKTRIRTALGALRRALASEGDCA